MITVVTPTYNRAHTLGRCYESLLRQTSSDFSWMIIDDGSTDNTEELVSGWIAEGKIPISYHKKPNGGKASALNVGIGLLTAPYAVCLDSDGTFTDDAILLALELLEGIADDDSLCGITALRNHENSDKVMGGREIPDAFEEVTMAQLMELDLRTEYITFYKTKILKDFRFPEYEGEKFVPPSWMMFAVTQEHRFKVSHKRFCQCDYYTDGLTRNKRKVIVKNPRGYSAAKLWYFNSARNKKLLIKHGIMYVCGCLIAKDKNWLKNAKHKLWAVLFVPPAVYVYLRRFRKLVKAK